MREFPLVHVHFVDPVQVLSYIDFRANCWCQDQLSLRLPVGHIAWLPLLEVMFWYFNLCTGKAGTSSCGSRSWGHWSSHLPFLLCFGKALNETTKCFLSQGHTVSSSAQLVSQSGRILCVPYEEHKELKLSSSSSWNKAPDIPLQCFYDKIKKILSDLMNLLGRPRHWNKECS